MLLSSYYNKHKQFFWVIKNTHHIQDMYQSAGQEIKRPYVLKIVR